MGHSKTRRRKKNQKSLKTMVWLPIVAVGSLLLIGAAVFLFGQKDKNETSSSGSTRFDSNFEPTVTGAPRVDVPEDMIDYGDVQLGTTVTTEFEVRNVGDEPLVILGEPQVEVVEGC